MLRLDDVNQNFCEGPITEEECLSTLNTFQRDKTPGTDGVFRVLSLFLELNFLYRDFN